MIVIVELMLEMRWRGLIRSCERLLAMARRIYCAGDAILGWVEEVEVS